MPFYNHTSTVNKIDPKAQYLVLYNDSYSYDDGYGGTSRSEFIQTSQFEDEASMLEWIKKETTGNGYSRRNAADILVVPIEAIRRVEVETKIITRLA